MSGHTTLRAHAGGNSHRDQHAGIGQSRSIRTACAASRPTSNRTARAIRCSKQSDPSTRLFWQRHAAPRLYMFDAGKTKAPNLKEGKARLVVEAVSNDLARPAPTPRRYDVNVVLSRAARHPRRLAALHQPGRHGTGDVHAQRIVERGRRQGGQVHLPQLPAARPSRPALLDVRLSVGPAARHHAAGLRAQLRRAPRPRRISGSNSFPRNSASAISRSTTR